MKMKTRRNAGFTLIELLIVIGLLGALTALVLPSLSADREEALGDVCDYNQAGTVRVLKQYKQLTNVFPAGMHNGMDGVVAASEAMGGLPDAQDVNMGAAAMTAGTRHSLTADEAASLVAAGITSICSSTGLNSTPVAAAVHVAELTDAWRDDSDIPAAYTFDGQDLAAWRARTNSGTSDGTIICLWIAPTVNWDSGDGGNKDWGKGNVTIGIDLEGKCPIPTAGISGDPEFAYYMAYFLVDADQTASGDVDPAILIGTSCPECGVINP